MCVRWTLSFWRALVIVLACSAQGQASAQSVPQLPARGVVTYPVWVRSAPPTASAFSYSLASRICSIAPGSLFDAEDVRYIINGEIWLWVRVDRLAPSSDCATGPVTGWLAGKLKSRWVVSFDSRLLADSILLADTIEHADSLAAADSSAGGSIVPQDEDRFAIWLRYLALAIGTLLGFVLLQLLTNKSGWPRRWVGWPEKVVGEALVAGLGSVAVGVLLLSALTSLDEVPIAVRLVGPLAQTTVGLGILGFAVAFLTVGLARQYVRRVMPPYETNRPSPPIGPP